MERIIPPTSAAASLPAGDAVSGVGGIHMTAATHTHTHTPVCQNVLFCTLPSVICFEDCSTSAHSVPLVLFSD